MSIVSKITIVAVLGVIITIGFTRAANRSQLEVGPNIRVSTDTDRSHFEPTIAAGRPGVLLAASSIIGGDHDEWMTKGYISRDGGNTWSSMFFPELVRSDELKPGEIISGDAITAAGNQGRLFFAGLSRNRATHHVCTYFYRSDDDGRSWSKPKIFTIIDHDQIVSDAKRNLVAVVGWSGGATGLLAYISDNNGRLFRKPVSYAPGGIALNPVLLADGTLFLPYIAAGLKLYAVTMRPPYVRPSPAFPLFASGYPPSAVIFAHARDQRAGEYAFPTFSSHGKKIVVVGNELVNDVFRITVRTSTNEGGSWSVARFISASAPGMDQYAPAVAINTRGVLGIVWSEMRTRTTYRERFSVSADTGTTFLPARTISSRDSTPLTDENMSGSGFAIPGGSGTFGQSSVLESRPGGGDYFGLAVDETGAFHPLWIDSRDDSGSQLYTARIPVRSGGRFCAEDTADSVRDLTASTTFLFDPVHANVAAHEIILPMRIRNVGNEQITGVLVTITKLKQDTGIVPTVVGSANGMIGVGATIDFSRAFGDSKVLPPNGVSDTVDLHLHVDRFQYVQPTLSAKVTGRVAVVDRSCL